MPIRINLLAETLAEEDLRRRDPVKRAIMVGSLLVSISLVWFSSIWLETLIEKKNLNTIGGEIQTRTNEYTQVLINQKKIADYQKRIDALQKLTMTRFLQGNLLEAFQKLSVPNVQMTRIRLDQSYVVTPASPPVTNNFGVVPGKLGVSVERMTLTVDAKDLSANAGDQVNHFKEAMVKQDFFKALLDRANGIRLANLSSPQASSEGRPYVMFTFECRLPDKTR
jgi:hypothetical protein